MRDDMENWDRYNIGHRIVNKNNEGNNPRTSRCSTLLLDRILARVERVVPTRGLHARSSRALEARVAAQTADRRSVRARPVTTFDSRQRTNGILAYDG